MSTMRIPVLIVDDEYLIRSLVRNSIEWESLGFQIVGEAEDGESALKMVENLRPLLMIVDINIPFMNGIDLAKAVRLKFPQIKIIILTGYEDFHSARSAIQAGVLDYILKPISPEEFGKTVVAARDTILLEERNRLLSIQNQVRPQLDTQSLRERFLLTLLTGKHDDRQEEIRDRWELFRIVLQPEHFVVAVIIPQDSVSLADLVPLSEEELLTDESGRIIVIANEDRRTTRLKDKKYYEAVESVLKQINRRGISATAGISKVTAAISDLSGAYRQAREACAGCYHEGMNRILFYTYISQNRQDGIELPSFSDREGLLLFLRSGQHSRAESLVREYLGEVAAKRQPREYCEAACMEIVTIINEFLEENGLNLKPFINGADDVFMLFQHFSTFNDLTAWIITIIKQILGAREIGKASKTQLVVRKAKQYIERNYSKRFVTLERIAETVSVSPSYLSSVFKKELGVSVIEFLTDYRLKAAKKIMDKAPLEPIMQIAERVGYSDPYYFSKCFRRQFGVSPSAYLRSKNFVG